MQARSSPPGRSPHETSSLAGRSSPSAPQSPPRGVVSTLDESMTSQDVSENEILDMSSEERKSVFISLIREHRIADVWRFWKDAAWRTSEDRMQGLYILADAFPIYVKDFHDTYADSNNRLTVLYHILHHISAAKGVELLNRLIERNNALLVMTYLTATMVPSRPLSTDQSLQLFRSATSKLPRSAKMDFFKRSVTRGNLLAMRYMIGDNDFQSALSSTDPSFPMLLETSLSLFASLQSASLDLESDLFFANSRLMIQDIVYEGPTMSLQDLVAFQTVSLQYFMQLSTASKQYLGAYAGFYDYKVINGVLRNQPFDQLPFTQSPQSIFGKEERASPPKLYAKLFPLVKSLDRTLACAPRHPFPTLAWRAVNLQLYSSAADPMQMVFHDPAYKSCSLDLQTTVNFCQTRNVKDCLILKVRIPENVPVFKDFRTSSLLGGSEYEIILPRSTFFTPLGVPTVIFREGERIQILEVFANIPIVECEA